MVARICFTFLLCLCVVLVWGQDEFPDFPLEGGNGQNNTGVTPRPQPRMVVPTFKLRSADSVYVLVENGQKYLIHTVQPKQTLYSIKRFYSVELSDLYYSNPELNEKMPYPGQRLRIPVNGRAIKRTKSVNFVDSMFVPVYYRVKPSETLFRVARVYFKMPIELVKQRNGLATDALSKNQVLHMGWFSRLGVPDSMRRYTGLTGILAEKNTINHKKYDYHKLNKTEINQQGAACWLKGQTFRDQSSLSVMHSSAPVGSVIRIENPITGRIIYAKVVGPVPKTSYADEAIVMLSPTVAHALGALDARFYVKVNYLR